MRLVEKLLFAAGLIALGAGGAQLVRFKLFQSANAASLPKAEAGKPPVTSPILGKLEIPRLGLSLPILNNDDAKSLTLSVGHIPGTSVIGSLGNAGIAGHRDTAFRPLRRIRVGDRIETHTSQEAVYVVKTIHIVDPADTSLLRESASPLLTLVTCYPFDYAGSAPYRFVIQAEMTVQSPPSMSSRPSVGGK